MHGFAGALCTDNVAMSEGEQCVLPSARMRHISRPMIERV